MAEENLFEELKSVLTDFKGFLDDNINDIDKVFDTVAALVPQLKDLVGLLIDLIAKLKAAIEKLSGELGDMTKILEMTKKLPAFLEIAKKVLPGEAVVDDVAGAVDVVTSLPGVDAIKAEIFALLDKITIHLTTVKA
ncbi:hypothetical protein [Amycolatopsis minnesotensis]|uniref:Uncharacterized protein n=1 Tax=Amycolatopsis minnesotensis TaxID=337894 RepID=A0ABN2QKU2_9PSEU